jgi:hypothetical protein
MKAVKRILAYRKNLPKGRVIVDTTYPDHSIYNVEDHPNWRDFYPDAEEEIPKGPKVRMTVYVDANHAHDLVTRRYNTGILVMLSNTPVRWVSKSQKTQRLQLMVQNEWHQESPQNSFYRLDSC